MIRMCYEYTASPPEVPSAILGALGAEGATPGVASAEQIVLTSEDGTQFAAYRARPASPSGAGIVILPDIRGLFRFYEELAERFATVGIEAIAIDYFGRTAGVAARDEHFEFMPHVIQTTLDQVKQDVAATVTALRDDPQSTVNAIFTVGFCFGGMQSLHQAANEQGLSGVVSFYGGPARNRFGTITPIERVNDFTCPVLAFYGGADPSIPLQDVERFDEALMQAGVERSVITYPNAPHGFFDRSFATYQQESADAWQRSLAFIQAHTPKATI